MDPFVRTLTVSSLSGRSLILHATALEDGLHKAVAQALEHPSFRTRPLLTARFQCRRLDR